MKINNELEKLLNEQFNAELASAYLYYAMANWSEEHSLKGFASWMMHQAKEEFEHAEKIRNYLYTRDNKVIISAMATPTADWADAKSVLKAVLAHEEKITASIWAKRQKALELGDQGVVGLLTWFVSEQEEEEESVRDILDEMEIFGDKGCMLYRFNKKMGKRG
jgi:ferritin